MVRVDQCHVRFTGALVMEPHLAPMDKVDRDLVLFLRG